jgi:hypothetical protein
MKEFYEIKELMISYELERFDFLFLEELIQKPT